MVRETKKLTANSEATAFTGIDVLCNYTLWHDEKWTQKELVEYHTAVMEYDRKFYDGEITIEQMSKRLWDKAEFTIEYVPQTEEGTYLKSKFQRDMELRTIKAGNIINEISQQYLLIFFNVLMDSGYGKKRLNRVKDNINKWLDIASKDTGKKIMDLHRELVDKVGIYVEMPDLNK